MTEFTLDTVNKIVSVIAGLLAIGGAILLRLRKKRSEDTQADNPSTASSTTNQTVTVTVGSPAEPQMLVSTTQPPTPNDVVELKRTSQILFIDDDRGFKIVGILKKMGWENTKLVTDISSLEQSQLLNADVIFVDIQGVGRIMQYSDEGLGLALAIKRRYPAKKVVIYSAEEKGARFHEALQEADYSLPKTAEPIRFEDTIVRVLSK
ncbi:response regulator [Comamonas terrae]|uniref:Response regulator n=1 Tax=Comamonas terrae TaxID=673548 RepID=A0ABW5UNT5_9BURK|nr:response regulator [Comamonas terrae]